MHKPILLAVIAGTLFVFAACKLSPTAQAEIEQIREDRAAALEQAADARAELATSEARALGLAADLAAADRDAAELAAAEARAAELEADLGDATRGTAEERALWQAEVQGLRDRVAALSGSVADSAADRAAWTTEAAILTERIANLDRQLETLTSAADNLEEQERLVKAEDAGQQFGLWAQILGTVAGGGALGKLLGKFGPSRATDGLTRVQTEMAAIQAALATFENQPSRASGEVSRMREKLGHLEGLLGAFKGALPIGPIGSPMSHPLPPPPGAPA